MGYEFVLSSMELSLGSPAGWVRRRALLCAMRARQTGVGRVDRGRSDTGFIDSPNTAKALTNPREKRTQPKSLSGRRG